MERGKSEARISKSEKISILPSNNIKIKVCSGFAIVILNFSPYLQSSTAYQLISSTATQYGLKLVRG